LYLLQKFQAWNLHLKAKEGEALQEGQAEGVGVFLRHSEIPRGNGFRKSPKEVL
jgi:hypothetical protein